MPEDIIKIPDKRNLIKVGAGRTSDIFDLGENKILKLYFKEWDISWVDKEYQLGKLIYDKGLPIPRVLNRAAYHGRMGIVFEFIHGRSMLEALERNPWKVLNYARKLAELQHHFNQKIVEALPSARQTLEQLITQKSSLQETAQKRLLIHLNNLKDDNKICHGDFHPANVLLTTKGPIIIDWMSVTKGNPLGDVAGTWVLLSVVELRGMNRITKAFFDSIRKIFLSAYVKHYIKISGASMDEIHHWVPIIAAAYLEECMTSIEEKRLLNLISEYLRSNHK